MESPELLTSLERQARQLSPAEQLWLIERLVHSLRQRSTNAQPSIEQQLAQMAADPEIQRELRDIAGEFAVTEADGLERE
jgi:hypothetical protein